MPHASLPLHGAAVGDSDGHARLHDPTGARKSENRSALGDVTHHVECARIPKIGCCDSTCGCTLSAFFNLYFFPQSIMLHFTLALCVFLPAQIQTSRSTLHCKSSRIRTLSTCTTKAPYTVAAKIPQPLALQLQRDRDAANADGIL